MSLDVSGTGHFYVAVNPTIRVYDSNGQYLNSICTSSDAGIRIIVSALLGTLAWLDA